MDEWVSERVSEWMSALVKNRAMVGKGRGMEGVKGVRLVSN